MRFTKVDENTITCIISKDELEEYDIELDDFIKKNKKVRKFMDFIITEAREQIGYEADEGMALQLQLQPLPDEGLAITLIKGKFDMEEMAKLLGDKLGADFIKSMEDIRKHINSKENADEIEQSDEKEATGKKKSLEISPLTIYRFKNMRDIGMFCNNTLSETKLKSAVIIDEKKHVLYFVLEQGEGDLEEYLIACRMLIEYGEFDSSNYKRLALLEDQCKYYIPNHAIQILKEIYS